VTKIQKLSHTIAGVHMWRRRSAVAFRSGLLRTLGPMIIKSARKDVSRDFLAE
jgi:hypothetical protein